MTQHPGLSVVVENLTVRFGEFTAVNRVSFSVKKGEIFGFLGANGAGKTTTIRVLCGLLIQTEGKVWVAGSSAENGLDAIKSKVGYMSQKFTLYNDLTVAENLDFAASLRKLDRATLQRRSAELFEFIAFDRSPKTLVKDLPGGIKQQVSLVAATLHDPEIVFLDEPTAGVTPVSRARFWSLIRKLSEAGKTVFVTTHYMDEAEYCGRIALMRSGELIALDTPEALKAESFPDPLFELEAPPDQSSDWIVQLRAHPAIRSIQTHGLRYHVEVKNLQAWEEIKKNLLTKFKIHSIKPSLEDVFIQRVEGKNR
jgi:ABC-2 type transport system ATP-binding protein